MLSVSEDQPRRCSRCGQTLALSAFNASSKFGQQWYCRGCQSAWYRDHRAQHIANVTANTARYRGRNGAFVVDYLRTHPCIDCGETDPEVLEFDHVRGKTRPVSTMTWGSASLEDLSREIQRCEVRCVNCHMRRTAEQFGWRKARERPS